MIFAIIIILLIGVIGFFHFLQGFFSATLSAIFAIIAAVFAFAYHETIVESLLGGKMANSANAIVLMALFALIYLALRILFDNMVPGNVRLPMAVDKVGAAIMGVVAGVFATGVLVIAAQELPFGPSIAGYSRYDVADRSVMVQGTNTRMIDSKLFDVMGSEKPGQWGDPHSLIVPVDDAVLGTVRKLSSPDGSLEDGRPLATIHPDLLQELFGQRVGIETGGGRVAMNLPKQRIESVKLVGLYTVSPKIAEKDPEYAKIRAAGPLKDDVRPNKSQQFLVVRLMFNKEAADQDLIVRFSPGACRLVLPKRGDEGDFVDVYPVGTLSKDTHTLYLNALDDFLFVNVKENDKGADLVYIVDNNTFEKGAPEGTFLEFKRLARIDLSGKAVSKKPIQPDENIDVLRKPLALDPNWQPNQNAAPPPPPQPQPSQQSPTTAQPAAAPAKPSFQYVSGTVSSDLPVPITAPMGATGFTAVPGGNASIKDGKADSLEVTSATAAQTQAMTITQAVVPQGSVMVKVSGSPAAGASSPWQCITEADQIELVDSTGKKYQPYGVYATYTGGAANKFIMQYISKRPISGVAQPSDASGGPKDVVLMYIVPQGVTLNELDDHSQKIQQLSLTANK